MTRRFSWFLLVCALGLPCPDASAQPAAKAPVTRDTTLQELSETLRTLLVQALPATLYEDHSNWGKTSDVPDQLKWRRKGLRLRPEVYRHPHNDGTWRRIKLTTRNPAQSLRVELRDWKYPDADHMTFTAALALDAGVEFEQQVWKAGIEMYGAGLRARMRISLTLQCEVLLKLENGKSVLPDVVFRLRVLKSDLKYDNLVVEHFAGVGGTAAKVLGEALQSHIRQWHPGLERDLIAKANAAIVRAADTRQVRLSLSSLLKLKQ